MNLNPRIISFIIILFNLLAISPFLFADQPQAEAIPEEIQQLMDEQGPNQTDGELFYIVHADKAVVYPGEPIFLNSYIFTRYDTRYDGVENEGRLQGFWLESWYPNALHSEADIDRRLVNYKFRKFIRATINKRILFPTSSGEKTIVPQSIKLSFAKEGSGGIKPKILNANPIRIKVREFPEEGKPSVFSDFSGVFAIHASPKTVSVDLSGNIILNVKIMGQGNIRNVELPPFDWGPDLKLEGIKEAADISWTNDTIQGTKTFQVQLVPKRTGQIIIPAISFSYFDLVKEEYRTVMTDPIPVQVDKITGDTPRQSPKTDPLAGSTMILLDVSGSMLAEDFKPENRLRVAKDAVAELVRIFHDEKVGFKIFARDVMPVWALSDAKEGLLESIKALTNTTIPDGTAIGDAIYQSVQDFKTSLSARKMIVLITDGANNSGHLDPLTAADFSKKNGISIFIVALGKKGLVPFPVIDPKKGKVYQQMEIKIDEEVLKKIASITGGKYVRAENEKQLRDSLDEVAIFKSVVRDHAVSGDS